MDGLRVLVADNSSVYRKMFSRAITEVVKYSFVTCVADGTAALELVRHNDFDIIVIDAEIQGLQIMELLAEIKREMMQVFILVTARPLKANEALCIETLSAGASHYMIKPLYDSYEENLGAIETEILAIIDVLHKDAKSRKDTAASTKKKTERTGFNPEIVLVAASTGGPSALEAVIPKLKSNFPLPVIIVQHMPQHFTESLARNLDIKSGLKVKVAESGEPVSAGTVYIAPGGVHMMLHKKGKVYLDDSPPINGVRPAADVLFESIAENFSGDGVLCVILTGMGYDGKAGTALLKEAKKCYCLAQSEKTCVVYGMPRAVIDDGLADKVLDLEKIAREIERLCQ